MKTKELLFATIGLVLGLLVGVVVISFTVSGISADDVRSIVAEENAALQNAIVSSVSTAAPDQSVVMQAQRRDADLANSAFFLVTMDQAADWYQGIAAESDSIEPEAADRLAEQILAANTLTSSTDLELYFSEQVNTAEGVLANIYDVLHNRLGDDSDLVVCLGLDNDPYSLSGPVIYLYLQVPDRVVEDNELPKDWELLDGPREESMLWSASCYDPTAADAGESSE